MIFKPVADLYLISYEDGVPYKSTRDANEAIDAIGGGFNVEEFVSLENHRAAMIQAGNHSEQRIDMVDHSGDGNEMVVGNSPVKISLRNGIETIRNSGISVDVDKIQSECKAGNSPVSPDGWIPVSERIPEAHEPVYIFHPDYGVEEGVWYDNQEDAFLWDSDNSRCRAIETVSHWMPMPALPAAPQQEDVK